VQPDLDRLQPVDARHRGGIERQRVQAEERDRDLPAITRVCGERIAGDEVAEPGGLADDDRLAAPDHPGDVVFEPMHDGVQLRGSQLERQVAGRQM